MRTQYIHTLARCLVLSKAKPAKSPDRRSGQLSILASACFPIKGNTRSVYFKITGNYCAVASESVCVVFGSEIPMDCLTSSTSPLRLSSGANIQIKIHPTNTSRVKPLSNAEKVWLALRRSTRARFAV